MTLQCKAIDNSARVAGMDAPLAVAMVPVRTVSEANSHTHWRLRQKRAQEQRYLGRLAGPIRLGLRYGATYLPCHVHLVRLASRKLDSDNLQGALKHVRDGIADWLGVDDGNEEAVTWTYAQETGHRVQAVRVEFYRMGGV